MYMDFCGPFPTRETLLDIPNFLKWKLWSILKRTTWYQAAGRIFENYRFPDKIASENSLLSNSHELKEYMKQCAWNQTSPLCPQASGEVESLLTPLRKAIRAARTERRDWHTELPRFLMSYRTTPHTTTVVPPLNWCLTEWFGTLYHLTHQVKALKAVQYTKKPVTTTGKEKNRWNAMLTLSVTQRRPR